MPDQSYAKTERNRVLTILVLRGYTLNQVASIYGITRNRVRQVALKTCYKILGVESSSYPWRDRSGLEPFPIGLIELRRRHKYRLISSLKDEEERWENSD